MTKSRQEMAPIGRAVLGLVGLVQVVFAFLAFWDLAHRDASEVLARPGVEAYDGGPASAQQQPEEQVL